MIKEKILNRIRISLAAKHFELAMSKNDRPTLQSRVAIILHHLIKWKYQPELRTSSWWKTINNQRRDVNSRIAENARKFNMTKDDDFLISPYKDGKKGAEREMKISKERLKEIPDHCEWTIEQILDLDFFPNDDEGTNGSQFRNHRWN